MASAASKPFPMASHSSASPKRNLPWPAPASAAARPRSRNSVSNGMGSATWDVTNRVSEPAEPVSVEQEEGMRIGSKLYGAALALSLCLPAVAQCAEAAGKMAPTPTPLSAYELYRIYGDKTWVWNTGGGRLLDDARGSLFRG